MLLPKRKRSENQSEEIRKSALETAYLKDNTRACGLLKLVKTSEHSYDIVKTKDAICKIEEDKAIDVLTDEPKVYNIYSDVDQIRNDVKTGELLDYMLFCYSTYDYKDIFPEISYLQDKESVKDALKKYNEEHNTAFYWTFLDKDEIEALDKKFNINTVRYTNI